jgi:phosphoribosylanthranilate isomerase
MLRGGIKTSRDEDGATNCGRKRKRKPGFLARHGTKLPEIFPCRRDNAALCETIRQSLMLPVRKEPRGYFARSASLQRSRPAVRETVPLGDLACSGRRGLGSSMLVQIYEISSPEEAGALSNLGVDHIGVLVGDGSFPREQSIARAREICAAISQTPSLTSALSLSNDLDLIRKIGAELEPDILHLGASIDLLTPEDVIFLKKDFPGLKIMRSIPVLDFRSIEIARAYDRIADILLLDSHMAGDKQIGALGVTHDWQLDRQIRESVSIPVIMAGGLGAENVIAAIDVVHPSGVDSKTKTDKSDGSHTKDLEKVRQFVKRAKSA